MRILVLGGAGYIGSHTCIELISAGHTVVIADNLCNSSKKAVGRVEEITGTYPGKMSPEARRMSFGYDHLAEEA